MKSKHYSSQDYKWLTNLAHDHILSFSYEGILRLDNSL